MSYPKWLKIVQKENEEIHVAKVRPEVIGSGEMAAGAPSEASRKLARIMEQRDATAKILVVGDGTFSAKLADYAIKMGQRLDCEIVALSIFVGGNRKESGAAEGGKGHFLKRAELGGSGFADKAAFCGVKCHQLVKVGSREKIVDRVVREIAGIRFVLSEPDQAVAEEHGGRIQLPVIDTPGSKL